MVCMKNLTIALMLILLTACNEQFSVSSANQAGENDSAIANPKTLSIVNNSDFAITTFCKMSSGNLRYSTCEAGPVTCQATCDAQENFIVPSEISCATIASITINGNVYPSETDWDLNNGLEFQDWPITQQFSFPYHPDFNQYIELDNDEIEEVTYYACPT